MIVGCMMKKVVKAVYMDITIKMIFVLEQKPILSIISQKYNYYWFLGFYV